MNQDEYSCYQNHSEGSDYYRFKQEREAHDKTKEALKVAQAELAKATTTLTAIKNVMAILSNS